MIHSTPVRTVLWLGGVESYPATLGMIYPAFVRQYSKWTVGPRRRYAVYWVHF